MTTTDHPPEPTREPRRAAVGIRATCPHAELLVGRVSGIDTERRVVRVETDVGGCDVAYEQLVIALGAIASRRDTTELTTLNGIGTTELARQLHALAGT